MNRSPVASWAGWAAVVALTFGSVPWVNAAEPGKITFGGFVESEVRVFPLPAKYSDQRDATVSPSVAAEPTVTYSWDGGAQYVSFAPFVRLDAHDHRRTHADIRELSYSYLGNGFDVLVGITRVNWSVVESRNILDVINQTDLVEDPVGGQQLGQPMVNLKLYPQIGTFDLYVMSGFRERTFPGDDARFRGPSPISEKGARYDSSMEEWAPDFAVRFTRTYGPADVGLSYFYGTVRDPVLKVDVEGPGQVRLVPKYDRIHQPGASLQLTFDEVQLRAEGAFRNGQGNSFFAAVSGIEYTFSDIDTFLGQGVDISVFAEYVYDGHDNEERGIAGSFFDTSTFLDRDVVVGVKLKFKDKQDTLIRAGTAVDVDTSVVLARIEAETRLYGDLRGAIKALGIFNTERNDPEYPFSDDSYVGVSLRWYF